MRKLLLAILCLVPLSAAAQSTPPRSAGKDLMIKALPDLAGKEALVRANVYPPGSSNPPHRHDAHVFLHLLEGELIVQLNGKTVTTRAGDVKLSTAKVVGNKLVIEIPLNPAPVPSASGKTLVVASTHGNKVTEARLDGKNVVVGLNAYVPKG